MKTTRWVALPAAGLALALVLALSTRAARAADEPGQGWVSLFDGKTMSGWEMLELPGQQGKSHWEVKDGALCGSGNASMLFSPKGHYRNFRCRAEVKINDKGNSGMYFRTARKPSFSDGYEAQIDATHADPIRTGSIYGLVHVFKSPAPPDEWFTYELEVADKDWRGKVITSITVKVNGETLYQFQDVNRTFHEGHFAFQQHDPGSKVCIRKFEVMELPATKEK